VERKDSPPVIRPARAEEMVLLPAIEAAADTVFEPLGIGPLPGPGTRQDFADALIVLVAGDPPVGLCRIDGIGISKGAHLEQLAVHPDHAGQGLGRALLRAGCAWAEQQNFEEITVATYRNVPWNGPFYASEGFVERGSADDFLSSHGLEPEEPVMGRFGARVLMVRTL
jgi:GNAT superfamily N-acetyltransferase